MCGIGALLGAPEGTAEDILRRLAHRGPDGSGLVHLGPCTLVMTRLAILDPSARADQPMRVDDHHLVYNGELVNHLTLRAELEGLGTRFHTSGDTEVVLQALVRWGVDAIPRFRGMFALAWWDGSSNQLTVARDPYGIKPLYWRALPGGGVAFASEATTLAALGDGGIDIDAVREFLRFGSPVSGVAWAGVREVDPGTITRWRPDGTSSRRSFAPAVATTTLGEALRTSVTENLSSDRPVDLFLSGGFDSAIIAATAARAGRTLVAHTLATPDNADDVRRARQTAAQYGCDHRVVEIGDADVGPAVEGYLRAMDQPTIDGLNTYLMARAVVADGFPVALSGLGGDELLGGYGYHRWLRHVDVVQPAWRRTPRSLRRPVAAGVARALRRSARGIDEILSAPDLPSRHRAWRTLFTAEEVARMTGADAAPSVRWATNDRAPERAQLRSLDVDTYLRPTLLRDTDVFSMANSVEIRVPLLDDRMLAAVGDAASAPRKIDLARACDDPYLVSLATKQKLMFSLPWRKWLGDVLRTQREVLTAADPWRGMIDPAEAKQALSRPDWSDGTVEDSLRAWSLVVLARWLARPATDRLLEGVKA